MDFKMRGAWPACSNLAVNFQKTTSASKGICLIFSAIHWSVGPTLSWQLQRWSSAGELVSLVLQIKARVEDLLEGNSISRAEFGHQCLLLETTLRSNDLWWLARLRTCCDSCFLLELKQPGQNRWQVFWPEHVVPGCYSSASCLLTFKYPWSCVPCCV